MAMPKDKPNIRPKDRLLADAQRSFQTAAVHLWPVLQSIHDDSFVDHLRRHGIDHFATEQLPHKGALDRYKDTSILLLTPIANRQKADLLAAEHLQFEVVATVDHYAQIEVLQQAAAQAQSKLKVLVAIDSGAHFFGCRPGTEAQQLVLACRQQPNLIFAGLTSEIPPEHAIHDISHEDSAIGALLGTASKLQRKNIDCEMMHLRIHSPVSPSRIPTGWHVSLPLQAICEKDGQFDQIGRTVLRTRENQLTATVIARPSLQYAVIDCGTEMISRASEIILTTNARIPIKQMDDSRCVLKMTDVETELKIGQQIQFSIDDSAASLK